MRTIFLYAKNTTIGREEYPHFQGAYPIIFSQAQATNSSGGGGRECRRQARNGPVKCTPGLAFWRGLFPELYTGIGDDLVAHCF